MKPFWCGANAAARHLSLDREAIASIYGRHKLGLEPVVAYKFGWRMTAVT